MPTANCRVSKAKQQLDQRLTKWMIITVILVYHHEPSEGMQTTVESANTCQGTMPRNGAIKGRVTIGDFNGGDPQCLAIESETPWNGIRCVWKLQQTSRCNVFNRWGSRAEWGGIVQKRIKI